MGIPVTYNTTADVFHAGAGPVGTPDIDAVDIQLSPRGPGQFLDFMLTVPAASWTPPIVSDLCVACTHIALMRDDIDVRDNWTTALGWTGSTDFMYVPDKNGVLYIVLLVDMIRDLQTGVNIRRAHLQRGTVTWPQQGI